MNKRKSDHSSDIVGWFLELELARERHDFERAAEAKRHLEHFGVVVRYKRGVSQIEKLQASGGEADGR